MEQEPYKEAQEHIVFGNRTSLIMLAKLHAVTINAFEGGYDDYYGALAWIRLTKPLAGVTNHKLTRFCPSPGRWMSGVRI